MIKATTSSLTAALAITLATGLATVGCDSKKDEGASKDAASATTAAAAPAATGTAAATTMAAKAAPEKSDAPAVATGTAGAILKYMPAACEGGRVYMRAAAFTSDAGLQKSWAKLQQSFEANLGGMIAQEDPSAKSALDAAKEAGLDLANAREMAGCMNDTGNPVLAVDIDFSKTKVTDPLAALEGIIKKVKADAPVSREKVDGVDLLFPKGPTGEGVIAFVAPSTLIVANNKEAALAAAKGGDGAAGFADASKHALYLAIVPEPGSDILATVTEAGDSFALKGAMGMSGPAAAELEKNPEVFKAQVQKTIEGAAGKLAGTPLAALADVAKAAKVEVEGKKVVVSASITKAALGAALEAAAAAKPEDLANSFR